MPVPTILLKINEVIINPLIVLLFALAALYFIWGVYRYWIAGSPTDRAQGARHVLWGLVGIVIMIGVFALIKFIVNTVGGSVPASLP